MICRRVIPTAVLSLFFALSASAQDAAPSPTPPPPPPPWTGSAQVSYLRTTGNTDTSVLGIGGEANYKATSPWSLGAKIFFSHGSENDVETLKKLQASLRAGRALSK